jgi:RNA polymerase primary sigma factor
VASQEEGRSERAEEGFPSKAPEFQHGLPLNRFFRLAVISGVESAVRLHIDRGDDLDARDHKGMTPLMLSAVHNRSTICKLLVDAGADTSLLDPSGKTALALAQSAGAADSALILAAYGITRTSRSETGTLQNPQTMPYALGLPDVATQPPASGLRHSSQEWAGCGKSIDNLSVIEAELPIDLGLSEFDLDGWQAEEDRPAPEGDATATVVARLTQRTITGHQPIDKSADWDDLDAFLPERATPPPKMEDEEASERLRLLILRAVREGSVPWAAVEEATIDAEGVPNMEASNLLCMVINDLGADVDERFEHVSPHAMFEVHLGQEETAEEGEVLVEALSFIEQLLFSENEPLRLYQREFQRKALLTADGEVALAQAMERGIEESLDALAEWPEGIASVLAATSQVLSGAKPLRWLCSRSAVNPEKGEASSGPYFTENFGALIEPDAGEIEDDTNQNSDKRLPIDELADLSRTAEILSRFATCADEGSSESSTCRSVIASLNLSREFLLQLTGPPLPSRSEKALRFIRSMTDYKSARDQMIEANLRLVYSVARKYISSGERFDDLLQEGNIGLLKAVDRYAWQKGFKFSTYAIWWIRQQIGRFIADKSRTIRLPVHVNEKLQQITQVAQSFELRHGRVPKLEEIANLVGLPVWRVGAVSRMGHELFCIHDLPDVDNLIAAHARDDFIACDPMESVEEFQLHKSVDCLLSALTPRERQVLCLRFGIGDDEAMTLEEIGVRMGVTRERIRQIEAKAIRRLRDPARIERFMAERGTSRAVLSEPGTNGSDGEDVELERGSSFDTARDSLSRQKKGALSRNRQNRSSGSVPTALDKVLSEAREAGIQVEDRDEGGARIYWVHVTDTNDNRSRKIVRKLIALGFQFWPGKGYWR